MVKVVYLFKEHENFQSGKSRLRRDAVIQSSFLWITIGILVGLAFIWAAGYLLRSEFISGNILTTSGIVYNCGYATDSRGVRFIDVSYRFSLNDIIYEDKAFVARGECNDYPIQSEIPIYYRAENPYQSWIAKPNSPSAIIISAGLPILIGAFILLCCFAFILGHRQEYYNYLRLQREGVVLQAAVNFASAMEDKRQRHYRFANYQFLNPNGVYIEGKIDNARRYKWPQDIEQGDILYVLYLDDETFCVL